MQSISFSIHILTSHYGHNANVGLHWLTEPFLQSKYAVLHPHTVLVAGVI